MNIAYRSLISGIIISSVATTVLIGCRSRSDVFESITEGDVVRLAEYLETGEDPNLRDKHGTPLLMYSAAKREPQMLKMLLEAGADPDAIDRKTTLSTREYIKVERTEMEELLSQYSPDKQPDNSPTTGSDDTS